MAGGGRSDSTRKNSLGDETEAVNTQNKDVQVVERNENTPGSVVNCDHGRRDPADADDERRHSPHARSLLSRERNGAIGGAIAHKKKPLSGNHSTKRL